MIGFEETMFIVTEELDFIELCVNVTEPPATDPFTGLPVEIADINIITRSQDGTAGITANFRLSNVLWYYNWYNVVVKYLLQYM